MQRASQQRIPLLIAAVFLLTLASMIGFALSVVYNLNRWQTTIPENYARPLAIYREISDASSALARLNSRTMALPLAGNIDAVEQLQVESQKLDGILPSSPCRGWKGRPSPPWPTPSPWRCSAPSSMPCSSPPLPPIC